MVETYSNPELQSIKPLQRFDFPEIVANLMHNLPGLAYRCLNDEQWTMLFLSEGCLSVTGYHAAELLDNYHKSYNDLIFEEDSDYVRKCVDDAISRRTQFQMEYRIIARDGSLRWVWEQGNAIYDAQNNAVYIDGYIAEITSRKRVEEEMKEVTKSLQDLNATKDKFFSLIAHDLQNPVYAIITLSDFLSSNQGSFNAEEIGTFLNQINVSAKGIFGLLENLLDWAKLQTNQLSVQREYLSLPRLLCYITDLFQPACLEKNIEIVCPDCEDIMVESDSRMLSAILRNLISNAIKYSHADSRIKLKILREEQQISIGISDKGIGISRRDVAEVFRIDFANRKPGTHLESGSGLGLVLVKAFADKLGASVTVNSRLNHGSTFTISLPLNPEMRS